MSPMWVELRAAIGRLNYLFTELRRMRLEIDSLRQQLRDARGG